MMADGRHGLVGTIEAVGGPQSIAVWVGSAGSARPRGGALVGFDMQAASPGGLDPGRIRIVATGGVPAREILRAPDAAGGQSSVTLARVAPGTFSLQVGGERGTFGAFRVDAYLVGDVDGDGRVDGVDLAQIRSSLNRRVGGPGYTAGADADRDGRITEKDLRLGTENLGAVATLDLRSNETAFRVPGDAQQAVTATFTLAGRKTTYRNEVGLFAVDDATGRIGNLRPGGRDYAAAALAAGRRQVLFTPRQSAGAVTQVVLPGASFYGTYLIQNATAARFLAQNRGDQVGRKPLAFFSITGANPDRYPHVLRLAGDVLAMEDLTGGGDRDHNDAIVGVAYQTPPLHHDPQVLRDTQPPVVTIAAPDAGALTHRDETVAGLATDDEASGLASLQAQIDAGPLFAVAFDGAGHFAFPAGLALDGSADGLHTVRVRGTDRAGNVSGFTSVGFTLDTIAPAITLGLDPAFDTAPVGDDRTMLDHVRLVGVTEPNLDVALVGTMRTTHADAQGHFAFDDVALPALGAIAFVARAVDPAGNVGEGHRTITRTESCGFETGLTGWTVVETGGSGGDAGSVTVAQNRAVLREGNSFRVALERSFVVPAHPTTLSFEYADLAFDTTDPSFIKDAFEAALVNPDGVALVPTYAVGRDAFYNVTEGQPAALGSKATASGQTVTVDVSALIPGTTATLVLRLVNNDSDHATSVAIACADLPPAVPTPARGPAVPGTAPRAAPSLSAASAPAGLSSVPSAMAIFTTTDRGPDVGIAPAAVGQVRPASTGMPSNLALTAAGVARGFRISTFASGFPTNAGIGPLGIAFPDTGGVLVGDYLGHLWRFPGGDDGQTTSGMAPVNQFGLGHALGLAKANGTVYMVDSTGGGILGLSDNGSSATLVIAGLAGTGLVANPVPDRDGHQHLFFTLHTSSSIFDIDPVARTATLFTTGSELFDGVSTDGVTLYAAANGSSRVFGFDIASKERVFDSGPVPGNVDGTALGTGALAGTLFVNTNSAGVWAIDLSTREQTQIADGPTATRGDFVTVAPDGSLLLTQSDEIDRLIPPPGGGFDNGSHLTLSVSAPGSRFASGSRVLVSGTAASVRPDGSSAGPVAAVTVDGVPVDAIDAAGRFFTVVEVAPGKNTYHFTATGTSGEPVSAPLTLQGFQTPGGRVDVSDLSDISASFTGEYARTSFDEGPGVLYADVAVRNSGRYPANAPLLVGVTHLSDPTVQVLGAAGSTPDGIPYYDASSLVAGGTLGPGGETGSFSLAFRNPGGHQFTYDLVFLGQLNRPPAFASAPKVEALAGHAYHYAASATDPDGDSLAYSLVVGPAGMAIDGTSGLVSWTPTASDVGTHEVKLRASDGRGGAAEQDFTVSAIVPPPDRPPVFTSAPVVMGNVGRPYAYQATATDPDDDPLTFALVAGPAGMTVDAATGGFGWIPTAAELGESAVTLKVDDGRGGSATQTFTVCVDQTPGNHAPVIVSQPVTSVATDLGHIPTNLNLIVNGSFETPTITGNNTTVAAGSSTLNGWQISGASGIDLVKGLWQPSEGSQSISLNWASPSTISQTLTTTAGQQYLVRFDMAAEIFGGQAQRTIDVLWNNAVIGSPSFTYMGQTSSNMGWTTVSYLVEGTGSDTLIFRSTTTGAYGPTLDNVSVTLLTSSYIYNVLAVDADLDPLTYSLTQKPDGMTIDPATGIITWQAQQSTGNAPLTEFHSDFSTGVPPQFSGVTTTEPVQGYAGLGTGGDVFSGNFLRNTTGSPTKLTLTGLPAHTSIDLNFLLAIIDSWDGSSGAFAPDYFNVTVDGTPIFSESFSNSRLGNPQSYQPTAGVQLGTLTDLGFTPGFFFDDVALDMGLDPAFHNIPHTSGTLTVEWFANGGGLQGGADESWGIDNVEVLLNGAATPQPVTVRVEDGRGGFDTQSFTIDVVQGGGEIRGTKWKDPDGDGERASQSFDVVADYSNTNNPSGNWSYGYQAGLNSTNQLILYTSHNQNHPIIPWAAFLEGRFATPIVGHNTDPNLIGYGGGILQLDEVILHPGPNGEYSVVRFTVPKDAAYVIKSTFLPADIVFGGTDVHVLVNGRDVFSSVVIKTSPGGSSDVANDAVDYRSPVELLHAGDTIEFAVGQGPDGTYYDDATGLKALISQVDPGLPGWTIYLDQNHDGRRDVGERSTVTDAQGNYAFTGLGPDTYTVAEEPQPGWIQTFPTVGDTGPNLLLNGDFEAGPSDFNFFGFIVLAAGSTDIPAWTVTRETIDYLDSRYGGSRSLDMTGTPGAGGIAQTFATVPGARYQVGFDLAGNPGNTFPVKGLRVQAAGQSKDFSFDTTGLRFANEGRRSESWEFTASGTTTTLEFISLTDGLYGPTLDNASVVQVSRPGTHLVELGAGQIAAGIDFGNQRSTSGDNRPPAFSGTAPTAAVVGRLLRYDAAATDPDADPLTFDLPAAPVGMTVDPQLGTVVWTPTADEVGSVSVVLRVSDGRGGVALQSFNVTVSPENTAPVITSTPPSRAGVGSPFRYQVAAQDAENDPLTYALSAPPDGVVIVAATGLVTWTPSAVEAGTQHVVVTASDSHGGTATQTFDVSVASAAVDNPPILGSNPRTSASIGRGYVARINASDPDGDPLAYRLDVKPVGMTVDASGLIHWEPAASQLGPNPVTVTVDDGRGGTASRSFTVVVGTQETNHPPAIVTTPRTVGTVGRLYALDLAADDPDGDPVTWSLDAAPRGMSIDPVRGTLRWTPTADQLGLQTVVVRASDPFTAATTETFTVDVACVNRPPVITSTPGTIAGVGSTYAYAVRAIDPERDPLAFTLLAAPAGMTIAAGTGLILWTPTAGEAGGQRVVVQVDDGAGNIALQSFSVVADDPAHPDPSLPANALNRPPVITSVPRFAASVGQAYAYDVHASDPEGQALTLRLAAGPDGMTLDPSTGRVSWTPSAGQVGAQAVTIEATDPVGAKALQSFAVVVTVNAAPAIGSQPVTTATLGAAYRYDVRATDPDGDPLTYAITSGPAGLAVDALGRVTWSPGQADLGPHHVVVSAADDRGASATQEYDLTVGADTQAPRVSVLLSSSVVDLGAVVTIRVLASDNVRVASLGLTVGGHPLALDASGTATMQANAAARFAIVGSATDPSGNVGTATAQLRVIDPTDTRQATVTIVSPNPTMANAVSYLTPIVGTVAVPAGQTLDHYQVDYARSDLVDLDNIAAANPAWKEIARGTTPVNHGVLATFDPTVLANDEYIVRVSAFNTNGLGEVKATRVEVEGAAKLGQFRLAFTDLTVPLAGIPITITRVYDSLQADTSGDFGYGWTLGVRDAQIHETVPQTGDGFFTTGAPYRDGTRVYLTDPDGRRVGFTFKPEPHAGLLGTVWTPKFVADPGVTDTLAVDGLSLTQKADGTFAAYLFGFGYNPDAFTLTTKDGVAYRYDQFAGLQTVTDRNGNTLTFSANGIVSSTGVSVAFQRDDRGRITRITDPDGHALIYTYNAAGDLVSFKDQLSHETTFSYKTTLAHYLDVVTDPLHRPVARAEYDDQGRLKGSTDALGNQSTQSFDPVHFTETVTDARDNATTLVYDARGNVVSKTDALNHTTLSEYGDPANPDKETKVTDPLGHATAYSYDPRGNVTTVTDALGHTTGTTYNDANQVTSVTDPLGHTTSTFYDARGNVVQVVDASGASRTATRDDKGRIKSVTDALGNTTTFVYDPGCPCGSPDMVINPNGSVRHYEKNSFGQIKQIIDENNHETDYTYDDVGLLRTTKDANGNTVTFGYDPAGNRTSVTDPLGNVTTDVYNANRQVTVETDPLNHQTLYEYDRAGNLSRVTDRDLRVRTFEYDTANRRVFERWYAPAGTLVRTIATTYDAAGDMLTESDLDSTITWTYDTLGRLATESNAGTPGVPTVVLTYHYDAAGDVLSVTDNLGVRVDSTYDPRGLLTSRSWQGTGLDPARVDFAYDAQGQRTQTSRFSDLAGTHRIGGTAFTYDTQGREKGITHTNAVDAVLADYTYRYDPAGLLSSQTDHGQTTTYGYDPTDQLTSAVVKDAGGVTVRTESYHYDANGNRDYGGYVVDRANEIKSDGTFNYDYDNEGNLIRKTEIATGTATTYLYDFRNRLVQVEERNAGGTVLSQGRFVYDVDGRRIAEIVNGAATHTVYNGDNAWADFNAAGVVAVHYLIGNRIDERLARQRAGAGTVWYLTDKLGTVRDVADALGNAVNHVEYDSFGNVVAQTDPAAGDRYLFTGRELDREKGIYYYRARYYDPSLGRFISQDPIGFEGGNFNLYHYVGNSPLNATDPGGLGDLTEEVTIVQFNRNLALAEAAFAGKVTSAVLSCLGAAVSIAGTTYAIRTRGIYSPVGVTGVSGSALAIINCIRAILAIGT